MSKKSGKTGGVRAKRTPTARSVTPDSVGSKRKSAREKVAGAARATGRFVKDAAALAGDLNRDGKVDQEDARIAAGKVKKVATATAAGAGKLGKKVLQHDMGKDAAAGAAIGAVVAVPIPIVGPVAGAAVGAIAGVVKNVRARKKQASD